MVKPADIKRARSKLDESQAAFARRFNVNQSTIHRWETGELKIEGLDEIGVKAVLAKLPARASQVVE